MEKKIAESINVRINLGNFQHIELTKYSEKNIQYNNEQEMIEKEDSLTSELVNSLIRSMRSIPDRLGKKTTAVAEVEEKISKTIPEWLEKNTEPNIANLAKDKHNSVVSNQKESLEKEKSELDFLNEDTKNKYVKGRESKVDKIVKKEEKELLKDDDDLFK